MSKAICRSVLPGFLVFVCSIVLPYLGNRDFLWFTVSGASFFGTSGTLYLINPPAMPVVLVLWFFAVFGFASGLILRKSETKPEWISKAGMILGIANVVILGWLTVIMPLFTWLVMGKVRSLTG